VRCRFSCVDPEPFDLSCIGEEERRVISRWAHYSWENSDSPILQSSLVRSRLRAGLSHPEHIALRLTPYSVVILDFLFRQSDGFYVGEMREDLSRQHIHPSLFAAFLPIFSAAMIHSSGLVLNERTALFLAPDDGGKTTVINQSENGTVLSDDQIILRRESTKWMAHATPWSMITNGPQSAQIGGFFLLEKADRFRLIPLKPVHILEYMWTESLSHRLVMSKCLTRQLFDILCDVSHQAPAYRMCFQPGHIDWDVIYRVMIG